jgi:hypothetical protein
MRNFYFRVKAVVRFEFIQVLICGSMICKKGCDSLVSIPLTLMGVKELENLNSINVNIRISDRASIVFTQMIRCILSLLQFPPS